MKDINLLPEEIKSTSSYAQPRSGSGALKWIVGLVFIGAIVATSLVAPFFYIQSLKMELDSLNKEINHEKYNEVKQVNADLASINGVLNAKKTVMDKIDQVSYSVNEVIVAVSNAAPKGCNINNIEFEKNKLKVTGVIEDNIVIAEFVSRIQRLNFLTLDSDIKVDSGNIFTITLQVGRKDGKSNGKR